MNPERMLANDRLLRWVVISIVFFCVTNAMRGAGIDLWPRL